MNTKQSLKNRSVSLKTVCVTAFLVGLLVFGTTYYVLSPATINVYLDDLPSQATYTIKTDGGTPANYWSVRYDGYVTQSTNASYVINSAITSCISSGGLIHLGRGTFTLTASITFTGPGNWVNSFSVGLIGEGRKTILQQTGVGKHGIVLTNGARVFLDNFMVKMPDANSGHGIYGDDSGSPYGISVMSSKFDNLYIEGCDSSHYSMYIKNPFFDDFGQIQVYATSAAGGVMFEATQASGVFHPGNCHFEHLMGGCDNTTSYLLTLQASKTSGAAGWLNLMKFDQIEAYTAGGSIKLKCLSPYWNQIADCWFQGLDLEGTSNTTSQIYIDVGTNNAFGVMHNWFQGAMWVRDGQTAISAMSVGSVIWGNTFDFDVVMDTVNVNTHILNDSNSGYGEPNEYRLRINSAITSAQFLWGGNPNTQPKVTWTIAQNAGEFLRNPNCGATASCTNGTYIKHLVGITPQWVLPTGSVFGEFVSVLAKNSTHFQVGISTDNGTVGTSQTIYWRAGWYSD